VIYSQAENDLISDVDTFSAGDGRVISWHFTSGISDSYCKCAIKYRLPRSKKLVEYAYQPENGPRSGQTLRLNEKCESLAEAERIAKNRFESRNRNVKDASIDIVGNPSIVAGQNITLTGFKSRFNGRYSVEEAKHSVWPYATSLTLRKI
jgi:phage protein D